MVLHNTTKNHLHLEGNLSKTSNKTDDYTRFNIYLAFT